jgi:hypothetical protein
MTSTQCVARGENSNGCGRWTDRQSMVCPASVWDYPADSLVSPAALFLLLCVDGCCVVVLDTRLG